MSKYKYILWDWNGTLLNDLCVCVHVMNRLLERRSLPCLDVDRYREIFGFPVRNYYCELGFDFSNEPFEKISSEYIQYYQKESLSADLREGCISVLEHIRSQGMRQLILSASQIENLNDQVRHFKITKYFDKLLGLDHCHATSKVEIGLRWLVESGVNGKDVLLIGDTLHDYETACELGCDCVLLSTGHQSRKRVTGPGVPVIESLTEVIDLLTEAG